MTSRSVYICVFCCAVLLSSVCKCCSVSMLLLRDTERRRSLSSAAVLLDMKSTCSEWARDSARLWGEGEREREQSIKNLSKENKAESMMENSQQLLIGYSVGDCEVDRSHGFQHGRHLLQQMCLIDCTELHLCSLIQMPRLPLKHWTNQISKLSSNFNDQT